MQEIINFLLESNTLAFIVSLAIFIITLWLVVRRSIGFFITFLLLIFALISGFFVANQDILRSLLKSFAKGDSEGSHPDSYALFKEQLEKSYQELKDDFSAQKKEFEQLFTKIRTESGNSDSRQKPAAPTESGSSDNRQKTPLTPAPPPEAQKKK